MTKIDRGYYNRATSYPLYTPITSSILTSELFLPNHLRLGSDNWLEFKLAIETILRAKGLPLTHLKCTPGCPTALGTDHTAHERWAADDELCKAVILLNVRSEHMHLAEMEHEQWAAADLWAMLMRRDLEIRGSVWDKWTWLGRVYSGLLGVACVVLYLMVEQLWWVYAELSRARTYPPPVKFGP
ncbi:uncharacterized protein TRAVEDRAFT_47430 [Trametes versicolor FP-101664 SS1]|uniref:uncharacterized protein n=1 Tax=Trametes versicolor (strain FP-101664) TaxID=717944 RepID=UPI0004623CC9|nr:uncharacterized protein TRAVEDRAFT_47430 [Trametes versicolor FP-101664 SS1]EIW58265.1 hypothetical protein TRAVEDRAFT_47430 [Trametes versicolor FP-101664 SS1]